MLTEENLGKHPTSPPSDSMLRDVGFDFDDLGILKDISELVKQERKRLYQSHCFILLGSVFTAFGLLIINVLFGLGFISGIMIGAVVLRSLYEIKIKGLDLR